MHESRNMEQHWITTRVVTDLTGWHPQYVRRLAREGQLQHRPSKQVKSNGRAQREYALSSLPIEAQLKFLKQPLLSGPDNSGCLRNFSCASIGKDDSAYSRWARPLLFTCFEGRCCNWPSLANRRTN